MQANQLSPQSREASPTCLAHFLFARDSPSGEGLSGSFDSVKDLTRSHREGPWISKISPHPVGYPVDAPTWLSDLSSAWRCTVFEGYKGILRMPLSSCRAINPSPRFILCTTLHIRSLYVHSPNMLLTVLITTILLLLSTAQAGPVVKRGSGVSSLPVLLHAL